MGIQDHLEKLCAQSPLIRRCVDRWPRETRTSREITVMRLIMISHRNDVPMSELLKSFAAQCSWVYRRRMRKLVERMDQGTHVIDALEQTPGVISDDALIALKTSMQTGSLETALAMLAKASHRSLRSDDIATTDRSFLSAGSFSIHIVSIVSLFFCTVFIAIFILPMLQDTYDDFGAELPPPTQSLIRFCKWFADTWFLYAVFGLVVVAAVCSPTLRSAWRRTRLASLFSPSPQSNTPCVLRCLAISFRSGTSVESTLSALARFHFDSQTRSRLLLARNEMEQGSDTWQSLKLSGLIDTSEATGFASLQQPDVQAWALMRRADQRDRSQKEWSHGVLQWVHPLVTIGLGAGVTWIAFAVFSSIYHLVGGLGG